MSENIIYAKTVNEEPNDNIPVAEHPRVVIGEYVENIYDSQLSSNFVDNELVSTAQIEKCWIYSKSIRFISGFDILLCIFNGVFYSPWLFILTFIPLCGYQGAVQFCSMKTMLYIVYLYTSWFSRVVEICQITRIITESNTTYTYESNGVEYDPNVPLSFITISCVIQLMFAVYVSMFICLLYRLTSQELIILRNRISERHINHWLCC